MSRLAKQLRVVQTYVLTGNRAGVAAITGSRAFPRAQRLRIYREGYYIRLAEALATTFPALQALLGGDQFRFLVRDYVDAHPSRHFSVRRYGHRLAQWLKRTSPFSYQPVLGEIAVWEWAMAHAFDAADADPVEVEALAAQPPDRWPSLRFEFHESLCSISTRWNSVAIWRALQGEETPPAPSRNLSPERWAIWRRDLKILFDRIDAAESRALSVARRGLSFSDICANAPVTMDLKSQALWSAGLVRRWVDRGWITQICQR